MDACSETGFTYQIYWQPESFGKSELWLIIGISSIGTGGPVCMDQLYSTLNDEIAGFSPNAMTIIMIIAGLKMAVRRILWEAGWRMIFTVENHQPVTVINDRILTQSLQ